MTRNEKQQAKLEALTNMPDGEIDLSDIPETTDWSHAIRGAHHQLHPGTPGKVQLPPQQAPTIAGLHSPELQTGTAASQPAEPPQAGTLTAPEISATIATDPTTHPTLKAQGVNMTTKPAKTPTIPPLPDPPQREPEDMTSYEHLHRNGNSHHLAQHFGNPEITIVAAERFVVLQPGRDTEVHRIPDLLIAFDADPQAYKENNGYIISVQGKPPDFVLEIASPSTAKIDIGVKRRDYATLGIPEYWRFDETGNYHGVGLAGDRLVGGEYQPIEIETLEDGSMQGHSDALNLDLRWEAGQLGWHDPATNRHIATFEAERQGRLEEQQGRLEEQQGRLAAEARVRELEAELARRNQDI